MLDVTSGLETTRDQTTTTNTAQGEYSHAGKIGDQAGLELDYCRSRSTTVGTLDDGRIVLKKRDRQCSAGRRHLRVDTRLDMFSRKIIPMFLLILGSIIHQSDQGIAIARCEPIRNRYISVIQGIPQETIGNGTPIPNLSIIADQASSHSVNRLALSSNVFIRYS